jgi:hypothetical protein
LVKNKKTHSISSGPFIPESIENFSRRRKDCCFDSTLLEGPSIDKLVEKANYFDYTPLEKSEYILKKGKAKIKRDL